MDPVADGPGGGLAHAGVRHPAAEEHEAGLAVAQQERERTVAHELGVAGLTGTVRMINDLF